MNLIFNFARHSHTHFFAGGKINITFISGQQMGGPAGKLMEVLLAIPAQSFGNIRVMFNLSAQSVFNTLSFADQRVGVVFNRNSRRLLWFWRRFRSWRRSYWTTGFPYMLNILFRRLCWRVRRYRRRRWDMLS